MKRVLLTLAAALCVPVAAEAQSSEAIIEDALAAAPARARDGAAVIRWNADHTYETLREGSNRLVCYDRSDEARRPAFSVQCTSVGNLERVAQNRRFRAEAADADGERAMILAAEADGSRVLPEYGSVWIAMQGDDRASARRHTTVAVPGATTESTGLPDNRSSGGAWIMGAGTSSAHIMIPGN